MAKTIEFSKRGFKLIEKLKQDMAEAIGQDCSHEYAICEILKQYTKLVSQHAELISIAFKDQSSKNLLEENFGENTVEILKSSLDNIKSSKSKFKLLNHAVPEGHCEICTLKPKKDDEVVLIYMDIGRLSDTAILSKDISTNEIDEYTDCVIRIDMGIQFEPESLELEIDESEPLHVFHKSCFEKEGGI